MEKTQMLGLPIYAPEDIFDLTEVNKAHKNIEIAYQAMEGIQSVNANAEVIGARKGEPNLKTKIDKIDDAIEANTNEIALVNDFANVLEEDIEDINSQLDDIEIKKATKQEVDDIAREVVEARKGHATVGGRLDNFDSQLDNKANKTEVFSMANMGQDIREALTGGSVAVVGTNSILEENIVDNQVTERKTSFIDVNISPNLCNPDNLYIGGYYSKNANGEIEIVPNDGYVCLRIQIDTSKSYTMSHNGYNIYFTEIGSITPVSRNYGTSTNTVPNLDQYGYTNPMYMYLSFGKKYVDTFMLVEGEELPNNYVPYYNIKHLDKTINIDYSSLINIPGAEKAQIFTVGDGKDYATLTECLRDIKDNHEEKIIYIDGGEYNVFEEIGGKAFVDTIDTSSMTWRDVSDIVPNNTSIIGLGEVVLNFSPTTEEITQSVATYLSCMNVIYENFHMENITIICGNCRYAIHDETGGTYQGGKHTYKNVKLYKEATSVGYQQVFGCGFSPRQTLDFEQCVFNSRRYPFSCHNNGSFNVDNAVINARNCIFNTKNTDTQTIMFGNVNGKQVKVSVNLSNCYIKEKVYIKNESTTERPNAFDVTLLNCSGSSNVEVTCATNIYEPKIFI